jgi:antitoxin component of MazEF toxin-antitoxin module
LKGEIKMLIKKVVKRGDSNFILLPKDFLDMLNLKTGDDMSMLISDNKIILIPVKKEKE